MYTGATRAAPSEFRRAGANVPRPGGVYPGESPVILATAQVTIQLLNPGKKVTEWPKAWEFLEFMERRKSFENSVLREKPRW
jgi:hypothetical protein